MEGASDRAHMSSHQALGCGEQGTKELHFLIFVPLLFSREHRLTLGSRLGEKAVGQSPSSRCLGSGLSV